MPRIRRLREIVRNGELGRLRMINYWYYSDWLYRPRTNEELNPELGGGVTWRQGPHQMDIVRTLGGGLIRSVRAMSGTWDASRPVVGCHSVFLEFEDGAVASVVYSGYDHFNSKELTLGVYQGGSTDSAHAQARRRLLRVVSKDDEDAMKRNQRYGGTSRQSPSPGAVSDRFGDWVLGGPLIASFDGGDVRLTPEGLMVYGDDERREIPVPTDTDGRPGIVSQFYDAVVNNSQLVADGQWGKATLEVLLAVRQSGQERREIFLSHQVASRN